MPEKRPSEAETWCVRAIAPLSLDLEAMPKRMCDISYSTSGALLTEHRAILLGGGLICLFALATVVATGFELDLLLGLIPASIVAALQLYQMWMMPWFLHGQSQTLDEREFGAVHRWLGALTDAGRIPPLHLRVQEGRMVNAMTTGGMHRHFIIVGRGLLEALSVDDVKAVLAHEIGHVLNRDTTRRMVPLICVGFVLHALYYAMIVGMWGFNLGTAVLSGLGIAIFWGLLPGYFQRRWEFDADRRAVELIGDPEAVAQALERFCEVSETDLDQKLLTHPPMRARLQAIRRLGAPTPA